MSGILDVVVLSISTIWFICVAKLCTYEIGERLWLLCLLSISMEIELGIKGAEGGN